MIFKGLRMEAKGSNSMADEKIQDKLVYKLDEISRITKLDPGVIDTWEKEFYFLNAGETASGVKVFRKKT